MTKNKKLHPVLIFLFSLYIFAFLPSILKAQSCGFGCLGLSGVYGGYTFQNFKADGMNGWLESNSLIGTDYKFDKGEGYRVGTNLFRAQFDGCFLTAKGFFQFITEEYETSSTSSLAEFSGISEKYKLKHNYWGLGVDFGIPLFDIIDWKIVEGGVTFLNVELKAKQFANNIQTSETKIENTKLDIGYYVGSGIIIHIIPDYISIEGTASYNMYKVDEFMDDNGDAVALQQGKNFIENKGITTTVQLNLGFPL